MVIADQRGVAGVAALVELKNQLIMPLAVALASSRTEWVVPGPEIIRLFGVPLPVFSLLWGILGVALGQLLAPTVAPLGWRRSISLFVALVAIEIGIVIFTGQIPVVAIGWGIGLGFAGLSVASTLGEQVGKGIRRISDAFFEMVAARMERSKPKADQDA